MPIDDFIKNYQAGDDFDFEKFKADALKEAEKDKAASETALNNAASAMKLRDDELTDVKSKLTKAEAAAWQLYNNAPEGDADRQPAGDPDPNSLEEIRKRVFKPLTK